MRREWHLSMPLLLLCITIITLAAVVALLFSASGGSRTVSAHSSDIFGPACGRPIVDGVVEVAEWSGALSQTFVMSKTGQANMTTTMRVMNSSNFVYLGITVEDDEFSTQGMFVPRGDGFRLDFDNDHSGTLFTIGDDVLSLTAGEPQFQDEYIKGTPAQSSAGEDDADGGTNDGAGASSRTNDLNHFEVAHPLCSDDLAHDFCLLPIEGMTDTVGLRLEYFDAEGAQAPLVTYLYPEDVVAGLVVADCMVPDLDLFVPAVRK